MRQSHPERMVSLCMHRVLPTTHRAEAMTSPFLDAIRTHIPTDLHPLILDYADDCLDLFIQAEETMFSIQHSIYRHQPSPRILWNAHVTSWTCFDLYQRKYVRCSMAYESGWIPMSCRERLHRAIKHGEPRCCRCSSPSPNVYCPETCAVCWPQLIQKTP